MTRVLLLLGPLAVAAAPLLGVEVLANVRADAYGAAEQTADMQRHTFEFRGDEDDASVLRRARCFARRYRLQHEGGEDAVAAALLDGARAVRAAAAAGRAPAARCPGGSARVAGTCVTAAAVGRAMGERLARRRAPDVLVHAAVPKTGSMTLIAHLNNASALSKVYNGTTELLGEFACRRTDAFLARLARAKASGKLAYAPGHVALAAIKRCVPPHLDAAYLFALRDPIHTAHSAASFYPLVYDEVADAGPEWITASILGGDAHVAALTRPVEKHVACADVFGGGDDCHLEYAPNAVMFARSRSGACATTLGEFAYARRDRLEAAKSALASLDAFVVMEDAGDAGDVLACLVGARLQSLDGDRRNPTARAVGIDAARRALYENATRLDAELYSFAREAHAHLAATVRARGCGARQPRTPSPAALELVAPANWSVANGPGLRVRAVLRGGGLAECGAAFERCDARVDAWHGEPRLGGKVVKAFSATIHAMPDGGSVEVVADGVACSPGCANECYLTASITSESTVVATSTEPLVVHTAPPLRAAGPELADYLAGGQLGDAACSKLAWADPRYRYPDSLCAASSPQVFERIACAYSLGDYLGMPRLALNSGGDYTPAAIADAFPLAQRRAAALAAYGSGSILGRYYARVVAANVGFDWHAHPDASLLKAAFEDWVAARGDGAPTPIRGELVVHLRSGDRSRRFVYWDTGNLPFVDAYARLAVRVASNVSATRVSVVAASEFGHADALEAVRDDARDFCAAVRRELDVACARRRGATADEDLAFMARAGTLVVHFGGFSAAAAVLARGKVVGGPLFAPYAAGVRAERKRGGLAADVFSICAPPRAYVDLTFDLAPNGATTIFAPVDRLDNAARGVARRFRLGDEAWRRLDDALELRLQTDGAIVGAVVHAAGGPACAADGQSLWPLLDARGFAVVESALDTSPAAREDARARGWTPFDTPAMRNAIAPGDIVVLCLDVAESEADAAVQADVAAAARAAEAGQFRLAVLGPDRECRHGATLAAAAAARRLPYYSLDMPCDAPPPGVAGDLRARTTELQRILDALVGALPPPARHSVAELENMTYCR